MSRRAHLLAAMRKPGTHAAQPSHEYSEAWSMSVEDWLVRYAKGLLSDRHHWMGARTLKNPLDAWVYQELIWETKPDLVLELGSAYGGSALFFAHMLQLIGVEGSVLTIDHSHDAFEPSHPRIQTITGATQDPDVIDRARRACEGRRVMMIHDASHDAPVVLDDLRNYSPLVARGCYMIVEDGVGDLIPAAKGGRSAPGPYAAVKAFLEETNDFELDIAREGHLATFAPHGFLKRIS